MTATITVVDAIMGSGKTSWIIDRMNQNAAASLFNDEPEQLYIYVTPLLSEVDRIKKACPLVGFHDPQPVKGRKMKHLNTLIAEDQNICTTHALFAMIDPKTRELLSESNYTLVLDEETEWVREYPIKASDWITLNEADMVWVDDKKRLRWNHKKFPGKTYDGRFEEIQNQCDNGSLVVAGDRLLIWEFPSETLGLFREVFILTYQFEGSVLSDYLKANREPYKMMTLGDGGLIPWEDRSETEIKAKIRGLLTIIDDPKLNAIGKPKGQENPLSATWFEKDIKGGGHKLRKLRLATMNFYKHHAKAKSGEAMWSCYNAFKPRLKGDGYAKAWTACNLRATNDYADRHGLAYLVNVFMRPFLVNYLRDCGVEPDQDRYALSQLVQWIWRSRIRQGKPVTLFIPSERMRNLLRGWLDEAVDLKRAA